MDCEKLKWFVPGNMYSPLFAHSPALNYLVVSSVREINLEVFMRQL